MHPILMKFAAFNIYSYGAMIAIGFATATLCIYMRAGKAGLDKQKMLDLVVLILISGVIGARILYVALNAGRYAANPLEVFDLSKGGLIWYGGFFLALSAMAIFIARNRLNFWAVGDMISPYVALAQAFGRIGCFLNGCCYGAEAPAAFRMAVIFPGEECYRIPAQLYSAAALLLIFLILRYWQDRRHFGGEIFLGYCILYSYKRIMIEFLRGDNPRVVFGMTFSQAVSAVVLAVSITLLTHKANEWKKKRSNSR